MKEQLRPELGMNKTGIMMSPIDSAETREGAEEYTHPPEGDSSLIAENRIRYMKDADSLGTVPMPATMKGMLSSIQEKIATGGHAFLDKLGERIAFERTGTRLYEALLSKYNGTSNKGALPPLKLLEQFHHEECLHFYMLCDIMTEMGGDPTAMTPAADVSAVASQGWISIMADPRTTFAQCLEIILQAELVDNASWEMLIDLAETAGLDDISQQFTKALDEENFHLLNVRDWVNQLVVSGESVVDVKARH
jgi:ferritin-like protein